jgi:hypothetical protein
MAQYVSVQRVENGFQAARRMQRIVLWLMDLPAKCTTVAGATGKLQVPAAVSDPPPANALGWTTRWRPWIRHPLNNGSDTDRWALLITPELQAAWIAKRSQLPLAVRNWVQAHVDSAADLAAEWQIDVEVSPGGATVKAFDESEDILPEPAP